MRTQNKGSTWLELAVILLTRLGVLLSFVLISLLLPTDDIAFYALMGLAFIITIPYSLWLRGRLRELKPAALQFLIDLILVTGLVYFTGGIRSDFSLLYPLVILSAGIVGTTRQTLGITVLTIGIYAAMAVLLRNNLLVQYMPAHTMLDMDSSITAILVRGCTFALFGGVSIYIARRCDFIQTKGQILSSTTASLLGSIPAPAMLLSEDGHILFANEPACSALKTPGEQLCSRRFVDLRKEPGKPIPESYGRTTTLMREGSSPLPVAYMTQDLQLPRAALESLVNDTEGEIKVTLLVFRDISEALKTARQLEKIEWVTNATRLAGEMAHEIQAPLASLSASVQLLRHYEEKATAADWLPSSPRRRDRNELFEHIEDASARMDSVIRNFIDFAEFSPQDLLSIIKLDSSEENQGYIGHLNTIGRGLTDGQNSHSG